jgi:hypothetical protein
MKFILVTFVSLLINEKSVADMITLTNGGQIHCTIQQVSLTTLSAKSRNASSSAPELFTINLSDIKSVLLSEVAPDCSQYYPAAQNLSKLRAFWNTMHPLISKESKQIALTGLRLAADALTKNTTSVTSEEALTIVRFVKTAAIEQSHRIQASALEMKILTELGRFEEALAESLKSEDPRFPLPLRVCANLTAGICGHEAMRLFLAENPRWQADVRVHKERSEIYERTMDAYTFASLFGSDQDNSAQTALYHAAKFLMLCGDQIQASSIANTLRTRFPESSYAKTIDDEINRDIKNSGVISPQNAPLRSFSP